MSGFFGIFRPQGGPVDLESFEQMKTAVHRDGFDGLETHVEEKIAMGHLMLRVSPESKYDKQPLKSSCGNFILVGHFRLDYRDELGDKLGLRHSELEVTPDSQLAMLAYQKWKEKCVNHLEGDWAFVLYSYNDNYLSLFRDQFGYSSLFYLKVKQGLCFFSDIRYVKNIKYSSLKLEVEQILRISTTEFSFSRGKTLFENLFNLEHGTNLLICDNLVFKINNYWNLTTGPRILYRYQVDYSDHLFSLYQRSVASKYDSEISSAIFLSSGLDSTSVCYFLDKMAIHKEAKLFSFTSIPLWMSEFSKHQLKFVDEKPYVEELLKTTKAIIPHFCNFNSKEIDYLEFSRSDFFFPVSTPNSHWIDGIFQEAKKRNVKRIYNGQFGNFTVSNVYTGYMLNYLLTFKWKNLLIELKNYCSKDGIGFFNGIREYLYFPILKSFRSINRNNKKHIRRLIDKSCFDYSIFLENNLIEKLENESHYRTKLFKAEELTSRKKLLDGVTDIATVNWYNYSMSHGIETVDPTCDLRLLNFSTSIPSELFNKNGLPSNLFITAFRSHLPEMILNLKFRRLQSMDIAFRLRASSNFNFEVKKLLSDFHVKQAPVNANLLAKDFENLNSSKLLFDGYVSSRRLLKSISLINFFKKNL